ncbi:MAG: isochorismatase family protein, partial [Anaerolineales bacterium]|nr:isochorismatase family protein [Anaerolineales bacterium]
MDNSLSDNYKGVFDRRLGFGKKPAILVVDFINAYTTDSSPLFAPDVVTAVGHTALLLDIARKKDIPVLYTKVLYNKNFRDGGIFIQKVPVLKKMVEGEPLAEIVPELPPTQSDIIIIKQYASAFFGTSLAATLTSMGIDTIILTGCSTSGCIRASAVDGMQYGFRVIVPRECVADRHAGPHEANLFDINSKYGDVVSKDEVMDYLKIYESYLRTFLVFRQSAYRLFPFVLVGIMIFLIIRLQKEKQGITSFDSRLAWIRAGIYFTACFILSVLTGVFATLINKPIATQENISNPIWWGLTLLCAIVIYIAYFVIWTRGTLTHERELHTPSVLIFGLL